MPGSQNGAATENLSLILAEDAWNGDADAIVSVDGVQVYDGLVTAPDSGPGANLNLGEFDASRTHTVSVAFTNDAYGGTPQADRNLYVKDIAVSGVSTKDSAALMSNGSVDFHVAPADGPSPVDLGGTGPDKVSVSISEDEWDGDAQFVLTMDGVQVGGVQTASALHRLGQTDVYSFNADLGTGPHTFGVTFLNDAYAGTASTDRNLYIDAVDVNGADQNAASALYSAGTQEFSIAAAPASGTEPVVIGSGSDSIGLSLSEDAYLGNADFTVSVDGVQVGGENTVTTLHSSGGSEQFLVEGDFGSGAHSVSVTFDNDAYAGTAATDRNLYVDGVTFNGVDALGTGGATLYSNGSATVTGSLASTLAPTGPTGTGTESTGTTGSTGTAGTGTAGTEPTAGANSDVGLVAVGAPVYAAGSTVLTVGQGEEFSTIASAIAASHDGDVILVDAGTYNDDFAIVNDSITLEAVGGRVTMTADEPPPDFKGILTEEANLTVMGFDFEDCAIPDAEGHNGAGIRVDAGNLTLYNDYFANNQEGLLGTGGTVTLDHDVFNDNGGPDPNGVGNVHNVYINFGTATVTNSVFENAQIGHEFKSRSQVNTLTNNEFIDGVGIGTGSYDIDLPNGGQDTLTNNTIVKGPNSENNAMVHFGGEGIPYAGSSLTLENNLFDASTNPSAVGVLNQTAINATIDGSVLDGLTESTLLNGPGTLSNTYESSGDKLPDSKVTGVLPGSTDVITDSDPHTVSLVDGSLLAVEGGAGLLTVSVVEGHVVVIGGTGGLDLTENATSGTGGNQYTTAAGATDSLTLADGDNSIDSHGHDTIVLGQGNTSGNIDGTATVTQGGGADSWNVNGTATIALGTASTTLSLEAGSNLTLTGQESGTASDYYAFDSNGGEVTLDTVNDGVAVDGTISGGGYTVHVYDGLLRMTTAASTTAGDDIDLVNGDSAISSAGADTIRVGSGDSTVIVSGTADVYAGTGHLSVFGRGDVGGANVYATNGDIVLDGDSGNITYHGSSQANSVEDRLNLVTLAGGSGLMTVNGGSDNTVEGGSGGLVFDDMVSPGSGADTVSTVAGAVDTLELQGSDQVSSYGSDTITQGDGSTTMAIHGRSTLTVAGAGDSTYALYGNDTVSVTNASGNNSFTVAAGTTDTLSLEGMSTVSETGASMSLSFSDPGAASDASATVSGGNATATTVPGQEMAISTGSGTSTNVQLKSGSVQVSTSGADTVSTEAANASVTVLGSGANVDQGAGSLSLVDYDWDASSKLGVQGGSGQATIGLGSLNQQMTFLGGSGAATIEGGTLSIVAGSGSLSVTGSDVSSFQGGTGTAQLSLNSGGSDIVFGSGTSTVHELGWGAADVYAFSAPQGGADTIQNFRAGTDSLQLGKGVSVTAESVVGGSTQMSLSNGTHLLLQGIQSTSGLFG